MSSERRRDRSSSVLSKLGQAQSKITALEDFIRERERQFHTAVTRLERSESRPRPTAASRRVGLTHDDLLGMHSLSSTEEYPGDSEAGNVFGQPLKEHIQLKITRVLDTGDSHVPFIMRRLVLREYHIGPEGAIIGSGPTSTIRLPSEARILASHVSIKWVPAEEVHSVVTENQPKPTLARQSKVSTYPNVDGHFVLSNIEIDDSFFVHPSQIAILEDSQCVSDDEDISISPLATLSLAQSVQISHGVTFTAGQLEFTITALPLNQLLSIRAFTAARKGDLPLLKLICDNCVPNGVMSPHIVVTPAIDTDHHCYSTVTVMTEEGLNVNIEYQQPVYDDESIFSYSSGRRRTSELVQRLAVPVSPMSPKPQIKQERQPHRLLLHIAIENRDVAMVRFLLEKDADVNQCSGELHQNALHLAALLNLDEIMVELLRYGGDIEIRDVKQFQPLALTSSYNIRRLLLGTMLLCAASDAGDMEEVVRLVSTSYIKPNGRGLRHKSALHLACARGHKDVANFLLLNGAGVNNKGGTRQRTPLHYASLNNYVELSSILLEAGANEFARDAYGYTPLNLSMGGEMCKLLHKEPLSLCLAVQSGDIESVCHILAECEEQAGDDDQERLVDLRNQQSHAPLHLACTAGNLAMVRILVSHGANLNLPGGSNGWTPLFYAAMAGHEHIVEFLLSVGSSTEILDSDGKSMQHCVENSMEKTAERLTKLDKGGRLVSVVDSPYMQVADPTTMIRQESASSCSPESENIWLCTRFQQLKLVSQLLTSGPDRLLKAIETKNLSDFKELLDGLAVDPNTQVDKYCPCSAIVRVCEDGLLEFVRVLVEKGANVSVEGTADQIPLHAAARAGRTDIVQLLVESGANVEVKSVDTATTVLHEAARSNSLDTVEYLLSIKGVDIDATNNSGETSFDCSSAVEIRRMLASGANRLLIAASTGDDHEVNRLIVEEMIAASHEFKLGLTALHEACDAGHMSTVKLLLDMDANVNKQTHVSQLSPLHITSRNNFIDIAKIILQAGAKLDLKDSDGKVPFEVACTNQMRKVLVEARTVRAPPIIPDQGHSSGLKKCMICMDNVINTIILPCGHQAFCTECVSRISICALDRQAIGEVITVYK